MTFWDLISENKTKILGIATSVQATLSGLIAAGAFMDLLTPVAIGWLGIAVALAGAVFGVTTVGVGFSNTTRERVAMAMETALRTTPPTP